jgi:hypothetical protein
MIITCVELALRAVCPPRPLSPEILVLLNASRSPAHDDAARGIEARLFSDPDLLAEAERAVRDGSRRDLNRRVRLQA